MQCLYVVNNNEKNFKIAFEDHSYLFIQKSSDNANWEKNFGQIIQYATWERHFIQYDFKTLSQIATYKKQ